MLTDGMRIGLTLTEGLGHFCNLIPRSQWTWYVTVHGGQALVASIITHNHSSLAQRHGSATREHLRIVSFVD